MAVPIKVVSADNTRAKTSGTTESSEPKRARRESASRKDGVELLRQAANKRVARNSEKLADLLEEKALKGDLASAKTLVALADGRKPLPEKVKKRRELTYAQQLKKEPQWQGKAEDEDDDWRQGNGDPDQKLGTRDQGTGNREQGIGARE